MDEILWIRGVERLLIVLFGGMAIYLGYRLFAVAAAAEGSLDATAKGWKLSLRRVAPGVFFALFGMVVLALGMTASLNINPSKQTSPAGAVTTAVIYHNVPPVREKQAEASELIFGIFQSEQAIISNGKSVDFTSLQSALPKLARSREVLADWALGEGKVNWYREQDLRMRTDPSVFSKMTELEKQEFQWLQSSLSLASAK